MGYLLGIIYILTVSAAIGTSCRDKVPEINVTHQEETMKIVVTIGNKSIKATLQDNETTRALRQRLPLTMEMVELNGNEKYYRMPKPLPVHSASLGTIMSGDLMLWGSETLVLFYKTFQTSYRYTRLGSIDDPSGLEEAVGQGNVRVHITSD